MAIPVIAGAGAVEWLLGVLGMARYARAAGSALKYMRHYIDDALVAIGKAYGSIRNSRSYRAGAGVLFGYAMFSDAFRHIYEESGIARKFDETTLWAVETFESPLQRWAKNVSGVPLHDVSKAGVKQWLGAMVGRGISDQTGWKISTVYPVDVLKNEVVAMVSGGIMNGGSISGVRIMSASEAASYRNQITLAYNKYNQHQEDYNAQVRQQKAAWRRNHPQVTIPEKHKNLLIAAIYKRAENEILARKKELRERQNGGAGGTDRGGVV